MLDSGIVDVAIGLMLVYFLLALVCSGINELVEAFLRRRSKYLEGGIVDLLGIDLKRQLYEHSLLEGLYPQRGRPISDESVPDDKRKKPSYIPSTTFSQGLAAILTEGSARLTVGVDEPADTLDVDSTIGFRAGHMIQVHVEKMRIEEVLEHGLRVTRAQGGSVLAAHQRGAKLTRFRDRPPDTDALLADLRATIGELRSGRLREALGSLLTTVESNLDLWRKEVEAWFDKKMDRVSGWYGRRTRWWLFAYGIVIVVVLNADTALVARTLWSDSASSRSASRVSS